MSDRCHAGLSRDIKEVHHAFGSSRLHPTAWATCEAKLGMLRNEFIGEMRRFLPAATVRGTLENPIYWDFLNQTVQEQASLAFKALQQRQRE